MSNFLDKLKNPYNSATHRPPASPRIAYEQGVLAGAKAAVARMGLVNENGERITEDEYQATLASLRQQLAEAREIAGKYEDRYFAARQRIEELEAENERLTKSASNIVIEDYNEGCDVGGMTRMIYPEWMPDDLKPDGYIGIAPHFQQQLAEAALAGARAAITLVDSEIIVREGLMTTIHLQRLRQIKAELGMEDKDGSV